MLMLKIPVFFYPSCEWVLDGEFFFCSHNERTIFHFTNNRIDALGNLYETETPGYVCAECGEELEGFPELDHAEAIEELDRDED